MGTTAPAVKLQVTSVFGSAHNAIAWGTNDGTAMGALGTSQISYGSGALYIYQNNGTATPAVRISAGGNDPSYFNQSVVSGGILGIGTTAPTFPFTCMGTACFGWNTTGTTYSDPLYTGVEGIALRTVGGGYGIFSASTTIPLYLGKYGTGIIATFNQSAALGTGCISVGNISVTASATTYNSGSDSRLKENIQDVADIRGMINHLRPRTFQFIRDDQKETYIGFIAQEVRENYPQYISGQETETEYLSMDYGKFSPFAISACKDLYNENDALKVRIAALEAEVAAKSAALDALIAWAQTMGYPASS